MQFLSNTCLYLVLLFAIYNTVAIGTLDEEYTLAVFTIAIVVGSVLAMLHAIYKHLKKRVTKEDLLRPFNSCRKLNKVLTLQTDLTLEDVGDVAINLNH